MIHVPCFTNKKYNFNSNALDALSYKHPLPAGPRALSLRVPRMPPPHTPPADGVGTLAPVCTADNVLTSPRHDCCRRLCPPSDLTRATQPGVWQTLQKLGTAAGHPLKQKRGLMALIRQPPQSSNRYQIAREQDQPLHPHHSLRGEGRLKPGRCLMDSLGKRRNHHPKMLSLQK